MIFRVVLIFLLPILGSVHSWDLPGRSKLPKPHILGGESADIKDFPYQVSLRKRGEPYGNGHVCGASILDERHILTAAHCAARPTIPNLYYIVAASTKLEGGTNFDIEKIDVHDGYRPTNPFQFDVAVITLRNPLVFSEASNIKPISMVPVGNEPAPGSEAVVAGWGRTIPGNKKPELDYSDLMKVHLQIVDRPSCDKCLGATGKITERLICAGAQGDEKRDASVGDSGGPLTDTKTGLQIGIVSFGSETPSSRCPGVYTNLADKDVRSFIDKVLAS